MKQTSKDGVSALVRCTKAYRVQDKVTGGVLDLPTHYAVGS